MSVVADFDHSQVHISQPHTIEEISALERRAQYLRAHYARLGKLVYDRLDRWQDEHQSCASTDHEPIVEGMMYVIHCRAMDAVAVCESWQFTENAQ
jgi:hypothetical protein